MISFHTPEDQFTPSEKLAVAFTDAANAYIKAHAEFVDTELRKALTKLFGEVPSNEDMAKHLKCFVDHDHVQHFVWTDGEKLKIGEHVDLSNAFLSIAPPKIFNPEN